MANPLEICVVVANGQRYDIWTSVEVTHTCADNFLDHCLLTVAENSTNAKAISDLKLKPGDPVRVTLAGGKVIDGTVYLRQTAYDGETHAVQIGICSAVTNVIVSTVDAAPGQYLNQTLQQIASSVFGKVGIKFSIDGSPEGADMIFERVSEHVGETRKEFIERLAMMRNIHLRDGGNNTVIGFRGPKSGNTLLVEGFNILKASLILKIDEAANPVSHVGQTHNQDSGNNDPAVTGDSGAEVNRPVKYVAPETANSAELKMVNDHVIAAIRYTLVDGTVTVQGWLCPAGDLWWNHLSERIIVKSPMLVPDGSMRLMIKGIIHKQSSEEGTTTDILLCDEDGLGSGAGDPVAHS